jgi:2-phospho-L-lactate guanylyltransferase
MNTFAIVPVKTFENAKTRMSSVLTLRERVSLSRFMLEDTLRVLQRVSRLEKTVVVSNDISADEIAAKYRARFLREKKESGVNAAVALANTYCIKGGAESTIVIPQDLPLLDPAVVRSVCELTDGHQECIVICPSLRYDGTNMLLRKPPSVISTFYDNNSYWNHIKAASASGIPTKIIRARQFMFDIDTPEDAKEIAMDLKGGESSALTFLRSKLQKTTI